MGKDHAMVNPNYGIFVILVLLAIGAFVAYEQSTGKFIETGLVSNDLFEVRESGKIVPRLGVSFEELFASGVKPEQIDGSSQDYDGNWIIPLKGSAPIWLTTDLEIRFQNGERIPLDEIP